LILCANILDQQFNVKQLGKAIVLSARVLSFNSTKEAKVAGSATHRLITETEIFLLRMNISLK